MWRKERNSRAVSSNYHILQDADHVAPNRDKANRSYVNASTERETSCHGFTCIPPLILISLSIEENLLTVPVCPQKNWFECDASTGNSAMVRQRSTSIMIVCMIRNWLRSDKDD